MTERLVPERDSDNNAPYPGPQSPNRVLRLLETLAKSGEGLPLVRICESLDFPKTTVLNQLRALEATGYVANSDGIYALGPLSYRLGLIIASSFRLTATLHPLLVTLASKCRETVMLGMLDEIRNEVSYVDIAQPEVPVRYFAEIGTYRPLYCTAIGRAILAFQDENFLNRYFRTTALATHTPNTETDVDRLRHLLQEVRRKEVACTAGEYDSTTGAVAAPIFDKSGRVAFSVNIAAPIERLVSRKEELTPLVHEAGRYFSQVLGYTPSERRIDEQ
ncbi:MAG: IclR family transcriptional regulator [Lautropia sp.]